ncbi:MAG: pilin [Patescibacteria group bacterium]|jgi:hypothetical protein
MKKKKILSSLLLSFLTILIIGGAMSAPVLAQNSLVDPSDEKYKTGNYEVNDLLELVVIASNWILGIVGSLTLVMFMYGGFTFLISAGNPEKVSSAKKVIIAAVVGLVLVFSSYLIVRFVSGALGLTWEGAVLQVAN